MSDVQPQERAELLLLAEHMASALERCSRLFDFVMDESNQHIYEPTAAVVTARLADWDDWRRE